jgi:hypothetical protein
MSLVNSVIPYKQPEVSFVICRLIVPFLDASGLSLVFSNDSVIPYKQLDYLSYTVPSIY